MNFKNAFLGPRSIQMCHLRSKTPLTSVDCLRGPPRRIQRGHKSPHVRPPPTPPSLQQPPAPPCLQRRRPLHATREATPYVPLRAAGRRALAGRRWPPGRTSLPAGATTVRPPFLTRPAGAARIAPALPARTPLGRRRRAVAWPPLLVPLCAPCGCPRGRRLLGRGLARAATPDSPAHGRRPACTPSSHRRQCRDREFEDPGRRAPAIEGGGAGPAAVVPGRSPVRATWRCCRPHHAACGAVRRCWRIDLPPASGEAAREASGGRDGARMAPCGGAASLPGRAQDG